MKTIRVFFTTLLTFISLSCFAQARQPVEGVVSETVITYQAPSGQFFQIVDASAQRRVVLRIEQKTFKERETNLNILKAEVERLTSAGKTVLGNSGATFVYQGGFPIWGPHSTHSPEGHYDCLYFAEKSLFSPASRVLMARGEDKRVGYHQYSK
jgi:hypothetical protein